MRHVFHKRVSWALLRLRETNETGAMELPRGSRVRIPSSAAENDRLTSRFRRSPLHQPRTGA